MVMQRKDPDERQREPRYIPWNSRRADVERGDRKPPSDRVAEVHELLEQPYDDCA